MSTTDPTSTSQRQRLSRPSLFMQIADLFGERSSCPRANVGVIAIQGGRVVASGYVGAPHGLLHCDEVGCEMVDGHCIRSVHAEANLVAWAARTGTALEGATIYCTHSPCRACAKLLANAGVREVVYRNYYASAADGLDLLASLHIYTVQFAFMGAE